MFCGGDCPLKFELGAETDEVSVNRRDRQPAAAPPIGDRAVPCCKLPVDLGWVPLFSVPHIRDAEVVLLGPKERNSVKYLPAAKNVPRCGLPLTLGHNKMFDADPFIDEPIRPTRDIAGRKNTRHACLEVFVHGNAAINSDPCQG